MSYRELFSRSVLIIPQEIRSALSSGLFIVGNVWQKVFFLPNDKIFIHVQIESSCRQQSNAI